MQSAVSIQPGSGSGRLERSLRAVNEAPPMMPAMPTMSLRERPASLGVGEVWKRLIALRAERGEPADGTPFSLFTYTSGPQDPGLPIPAALVLNALIPGVGAIGNGVVAALLELPVHGKVVILDRQHFGRENLGTCLLLGPASLGHEKARVMADLLKAEVPALDVVPLSGDVAELISEIQQQLPGGPTLVLNGFDNRDARRAVQQLWADLTTTALSVTS